MQLQAVHLISRIILATVLTLWVARSPTLASSDIVVEAESRLLDTFHGVVLASAGGSTLYQRTFGLADIESGQPNALNKRFRIGSISKTFTAALAIRLADAGLFSLDDPISMYVEALPNGEDIRLIDLLRHESGLRDFSQADWKFLLLSDTPPTRNEVLQRIADKKPKRRPGKKFEYSNVSYVLLGYAIESATNRDFASVLDSELIGPLGLSDTGFVAKNASITNLSAGHDKKNRPDLSNYDYTAIIAAGGLYSTAVDLERWCRQQSLNPSFAGWKTGERFGRSAAWHTGNTNDYSALLVRFPEIDGCYVVLSNVGQKKPPKELFRTLPEFFFGVSE